ncbi:glycosyltransferase family 4 protein [Tunturiibacter empetritectus]|uniref:Glycosyltransferase involved in cell wall biosynthesis n=1 Tax=Tunturiibacter lichenicola TaxID=2051959 RepID=A0A852VEJ6_9BACT|nr:glycosyltransferase family 4 protein [Edaphobacter lichenicola]NYF89977.1 glycosyltransferase involved in cell wall biosynthesis [Edaphobacter lichenicola]
MRSPDQSRENNKKKVKVAYLVSHPIQYQAPLLRRIAQEPDIELTVFFGSDFSVQEYVDKGFGVDVKWDVPLLDGYRYEFLPAIWDKRRTGPTSQLNYGIFSRLRGNNAARGFDLLWVHGYSTLNALQGMLASKALGIPVLLRAESRLGRKQSDALKQIVKHLFFGGLKQLVDGVLPIGSLNAAYWRHTLGEELPQFPMPYAVDNNYFQSRSREADLRRGDLLRELNLDASRPIILFASKLQRRKRCEDLLEAYLSLCSEVGSEPVPYLLIVGDGEERAALERRASESGDAGVRFCGFRNQSELPVFFSLATVFVLPSQDEPWGLIVNEAMNSGCAIILSDDVGCQPDLVSDGVEGFVFPVGDVDALRDALRRVLESPETAKALGQRGLKRISGWSYEEDLIGLRRAISAVTRRLST